MNEETAQIDVNHSRPLDVHLWSDYAEINDLVKSIFDWFSSEEKLQMKWSGKFGQRAKVYPTRTNGYENDKTTELFRPV